MKIKEQTRKLAAGCSKHCFEVVDRLTKSAQNTVLRLWMKLTKSVEVVDRTDKVSNHTHGKVKLTWFEEILEEY
ncbi:hypothetical protein [Streptococcus pneumoniae]|uniref:hypothetical protein n=1 Tax=Streptococcus pneumoniae TaxID=1313 RepID=UPI0005DBFAC3|nr:hypothetical protein [Streptococcus pneumoniae]CNV58272.1 N-ethylammeline chlorohydrolase [Streptococcus pneumoniae]